MYPFTLCYLVRGVFVFQSLIIHPAPCRHRFVSSLPRLLIYQSPESLYREGAPFFLLFLRRPKVLPPDRAFVHDSIPSEEGHPSLRLPSETQPTSSDS